MLLNFQFKSYYLPYTDNKKHTQSVKINRYLLVDTKNKTLDSIDITDNSIKKHGYISVMLSQDDYFNMCNELENNGYKWDLGF